jgi:DNA-binding XRE family transcriptional regulator
MKKDFSDSKYQNIKAAVIVDDEVAIKINTLFNNNDFQVAYSKHEIVIRNTVQPAVIPWDKIRTITDKDFNKYLVKEAEKNSKLLGKRIKELRESIDMDSKEVAKRTGVSVQTMSRLENGKQDLSFSTLNKILACMGFKLKDLAL